MIYTVEASMLKNEVPDGKYGPMKSVTLTLKPVDSDQVVTAEWFTKAATPIPAPGATLEGTIEQSDYGTKFKKIKPADLNFGARSEDPKKSAAIQRMHSQEMALRFAAIVQSQGNLPDKVSVDAIFKLADRFDADAETKRNAA